MSRYSTLVGIAEKTAAAAIKTWRGAVALVAAYVIRVFSTTSQCRMLQTIKLRPAFSCLGSLLS